MLGFAFWEENPHPKCIQLFTHIYFQFAFAQCGWVGSFPATQKMPLHPLSLVQYAQAFDLQHHRSDWIQEPGQFFSSPMCLLKACLHWCSEIMENLERDLCFCVHCKEQVMLPFLLSSFPPPSRHFSLRSRTLNKNTDSNKNNGYASVINVFVCFFFFLFAGQFPDTGTSSDTQRTER